MVTTPQEPTPDDRPLERDLPEPEPPPQDPNEPPIDETPADADVLRDTRGRESEV